MLDIVINIIIIIIIYFTKLNNLNIENLVSASINIFSIIFSVLLLLADNLTNKENLSNRTISEKKYFFNETIPIRKIKIICYYTLFLITIILLLITSSFKITNYIFIKILIFLIINCFLSSYKYYYI